MATFTIPVITSTLSILTTVTQLTTTISQEISEVISIVTTTTKDTETSIETTGISTLTNAEEIIIIIVSFLATLGTAIAVIVRELNKYREKHRIDKIEVNRLNQVIEGFQIQERERPRY